MRRPSIIPLALALSSAPALGAPTAPATFKQQISQLADLDEAGIGFSPSMTGMQFLPDPGSDEQGMLVLGQRPPGALRRADEARRGRRRCGVRADRVPRRHHADKLPPMRAIMPMETSDEYDYNRRTTHAPAGVNRQGDPLNPVDHVVTVGELCFVALGQIVDRSFAAVRYQPTGGLIVNAPTSPPLRRDSRRMGRG